MSAPLPGLAVWGDVTVGRPLSTSGYGQQTYGNTEPASERARWLQLAADGRATLYAGKVEYGQNIRTGLAVEVADELRLPLERVDVVLGDTAHVPWDMGTFGSQSTARVGLQLRRAAASARQALLVLAADHLDLPAQDLEARSGRIHSRTDERHGVSYQDLLSDQHLEIDLDAEAPLLGPAEFELIGATHTRRLDAVGLVTGETDYSQDVLPPDLLFADVIRPPAYGAEPRHVDFGVAAQLPGVVATMHDGSLVAVLAETDEAAARAAGLVEVDWRLVSGQPASWELPALLVASGREGFETQQHGDLESAFREAETVHEESYFIPYIAPTPMEPRAAVAQWAGDRLTVWAGTQRPFGIRAELAGALGLDESLVRVIAPQIGGGYGAKSPYAPALEAARLAREAGRAVRVAYSRADEAVWSNFRPAAVIQIRSGLSGEGRIVAWESHAYHAGERVTIGRRGSETPYDARRSDRSSTAQTVPCPQARTDRWGQRSITSHARSTSTNSPIWRAQIRWSSGYATSASDRFRRVLETAATAFDWQGPQPAAGRGAGIALGIDVGSYVAAAAEVSRQGTEVRVHRVAAALDCGLVVNPKVPATRWRGRS